MSNQEAAAAEERRERKNKALVRVIEYGLIAALKNSGMELRGIAIKYDEFNVLMTVKANADGRWFVAHIGTDSIANCFIKAGSEASRNKLRWQVDKYQPNNV